VSFIQTPWSSTHVVYYDVLTKYKSNIPFPVARHKYIMKCDKYILQPFFEDLNKSMSTLVIGNHSVSSVTVRSSSRHPVCACCQLSRSASWTSWPLKMRQMAIPKYQNYQFILHTIPEETRSQNMFNVSGFPSGESQMVKYNCVLWHVRKQCLEG